MIPVVQIYYFMLTEKTYLNWIRSSSTKLKAIFVTPIPNSITLKNFIFSVNIQEGNSALKETQEYKEE